MGNSPSSKSSRSTVRSLSCSSPIEKNASNFPELVEMKSPRRQSVHAGLENPLGHNNCFLNVCIQAMWHLDAFRDAILRSEHSLIDKSLEGSASASSDPKNTLLYKIHQLFRRYASTGSYSGPLKSSDIRITLASLYGSQNRFQLGQIDDATEAFDCILKCIHANHISDKPGLQNALAKISVDGQLDVSRSIDIPCEEGMSRGCVACSVFGYDSFDKSVCGTCGITSEPIICRELVYLVYAHELSAVIYEQRSTKETPELSKLLRQIVCTFSSLFFYKNVFFVVNFVSNELFDEKKYFFIRQ